MGRDIFLWALLIVIEVVGLTLMVNQPWVKGQIVKERQLMVGTLGLTSARQVVQEANATYQAGFVRTGMEAESYRMFAPQPSQTRGPTWNGLDRYTGKFIKRLDTFWLAVYQATVRVTLLAQWLPYLLPLLLPALVEGFCRREVKKTNYGYTSPNRFHAASHGLIALVFLPILYLFLPIAITPLVVPVWGIALAALLIVLGANLQKQL